MISNIIVLVILHYSIEASLFVATIALDNYFNAKKDGSLAEFINIYFKVPSLLLGMYISSFWDLTFSPILIFLITRSFIIQEIEKRFLKKINPDTR